MERGAVLLLGVPVVGSIVVPRLNGALLSEAGGRLLGLLVALVGDVRLTPVAVSLLVDPQD